MEGLRIGFHHLIWRHPGIYEKWIAFPKKHNNWLTLSSSPSTASGILRRHRPLSASVSLSSLCAANVPSKHSAKFLGTLKFVHRIIGRTCIWGHWRNDWLTRQKVSQAELFPPGVCETICLQNGDGVGDAEERELVGAVHRPSDWPARRVRLDESAAFDEASLVGPTGAEEARHEHL